MALSDCEKCWDTPCRCGHQYEKMPLYELKKIRDAVNRVYEQRAAAGESDRDPFAP